MSVLTKNNYIKANALMSYTDIASADVEVLQQTATDMGYDEFAQATNGDLLMKKTEVVGSYTYVTTFNCRTEDVSVTVTASPKIVFADSDVKAIVANAYGSDGEITEEQAAAVTTWFSGNDTSSNPFYENTKVDSFDEFGTYFTSVTAIGDSAFGGCENMQSITLPSSLTSISDYAFWSCCSIKRVTIPENVTSIGNRVFDVCTLLESITISNGVTSIGERVFNNCQNLTYISVDSSNPYFNDGNGSNAIIDNNGKLLYGGRACTVIPNTVNSIGDYAFMGRAKQTLTIPSSVTSIGTGAFYLCYNLTSLTIPASVTSIGPSAFYNCYGLTNLTISNSVTSIGRDAFSSCSKLTSITCEATTPPTLGSDAFNYTNDCPIYVPSASLDAYKSAWSSIADRIFPITESENE